MVHLTYAFLQLCEYTRSLFNAQYVIHHFRRVGKSVCCRFVVGLLSVCSFGSCLYFFYEKYFNFFTERCYFSSFSYFTSNAVDPYAVDPYAVDPNAVDPNALKSGSEEGSFFLQQQNKSDGSARSKGITKYTYISIFSIYIKSLNSGCFDIIYFKPGLFWHLNGHIYTFFWIYWLR